MTAAQARLWLGGTAAICLAALVYLTRAYLSPGEMTIFDAQATGYDLADAQAYVAALGGLERAIHTGPYRVLDTIFPICLAGFLALVLHRGTRHCGVVPQVLLMTLPGGYLVMDLSENALVGQILLRDPGALELELVDLASRFTEAKYVLLGSTGAAVLVSMGAKWVAGRRAA